MSCRTKQLRTFNTSFVYSTLITRLSKNTVVVQMLIAYEWELKISITITYFPLSDNSTPHNPPDNSTMSLAPEDYVRLLSSAFYLHPLLPTPGGGDCVIFGAVA